METQRSRVVVRFTRAWIRVAVGLGASFFFLPFSLFLSLSRSRSRSTYLAFSLSLVPLSSPRAFRPRDTLHAPPHTPNEPDHLHPSAAQSKPT